MSNKTPRWNQHSSLDDALQQGLREEEFQRLVEGFGRPLTILETGICSALFSEHCSYKSSKVHLRTLPSEGKRVLQGPGENAGVIDIGDGKAVVFKVESHNHPSFIEPFQGAATGVGGILRDVFTMGARPIALLNSLRFGQASNSKTKYLLNRAVAGIGGYGNCVGVPTIGGELYFHESYDGNCLVNAFALGLIDSDKIFLGKAAGIGNSVFYVGSKTGRDGIHGATMASESFDDNSAEKRPTVQVGDPFQEKLLIEACLEVMATGAVIGIQDMGAAGMTSSTYEMAERAGTGVRIDLDLVPQRETEMTPYEIMLSESQERMLIVIEQGRESEVFDIFHKWDLDVVKIGEVIDGNAVNLYWHGELVSSIAVPVLMGTVPQHRWPEAPAADYEQKLSFDLSSFDKPDNLSEVWLKLLASVNLSSRHQVYRQYDSTVRTNTVVHPGGDAGLIRIKDDSRPNVPEKGIAITLDCNSRYCGIDPRQGTALSLAEACRNVSAVGAEPIGISDCLNFGSPERPDGMWQLAEAIRGLGEAARAYQLPIVSGNVSLYNETKGRPILPTPLLAVVGLMPDASLSVAAKFKQAGDVILVIGEADADEIGGSAYLAEYAQIEKGKLPNLDYDREIKVNKFIRELIAKKLICSAHDISSGGLAISLAECCISEYNNIGAHIRAKNVEGRLDGILFTESGARFIVSCPAAQKTRIEELAKKAKITISYTGTVGGDSIIIDDIAKISLSDATQAYLNGLSQLIS
jgi:phosphoribosylformylglycinamidine synthase subunit PurL